ncbi:MAG: hypothetical protein A2562_04005 [Candidatus Nealsonbacteria bacterium RIFOXYD1_FULL_39_11]|nr:MAG: hypothetical protein A2562_04005 [Candidatus Nealsonbacteria bacterium RIFOXYD1_FULL_39_11]
MKINTLISSVRVNTLKLVIGSVFTLMWMVRSTLPATGDKWGQPPFNKRRNPGSLASRECGFFGNVMMV